jgi:putative transposase
MPIRKILANGGIYHVIIRGVADMPIFKNDQDRFRMIFSLYEFNNDKPVVIREKRRARNKNNTKSYRGPSSVNLEKREILVEVLAFCFMPNHIHLLLRQVKDNGITRFMRKLGTGYAGYFNKKHDRSGYLFQGRFKSVHIKNNAQLLVVFSYIHTNPVALVEPAWKKNKVKNFKEVIKFLEGYKWSSYLDYSGRDNFPSLIKKNFLLEAFGGQNNCKKIVNDWVKYKSEIKSFGDILLD